MLKFTIFILIASLAKSIINITDNQEEMCKFQQKSEEVIRMEQLLQNQNNSSDLKLESLQDQKEYKLAPQRLLNINNFEIILQEQNNQTKLFSSEQNTQIYLDLKIRGWMFKFLNPIKIQKFSKNTIKQIISNEIGRINSNKQNISQIRLFKPQEQSYFETSQLQNNNWRIDVFPQHDNTEIKLMIKFKVNSENDSNLIRKYNYLLDTRKLGAINRE